MPIGNPRWRSAGRYMRRPPTSGSSIALNASATHAMIAACCQVNARSRNAKPADPMWTHWRARSECRLTNTLRDDRRERAPDAVGERRHRVAEGAHGFAAVERPIVPEDLDGAARDERRAAEEIDAKFLERAERAGDRKRNPHRQRAARRLADDLEHAPLRRVFAADHIPSAGDAPLERGT